MTDVTIWLDPVCPYSWNTAQWLKAVADKRGLEIDWRLINLAVLNRDREMPPKQRERMHDSELIGRLMIAIRDRHGNAGLAAAYFAFGERYFDRSAAIDDDLVAHVLDAAQVEDIAAAVTTDSSLDERVEQSHQAGQEALGETAGSPIVRINAHTFFGPVLTAPPEPAAVESLFDAIATLGTIPQFAQLQRPRAR